VELFDYCVQSKPSMQATFRTLRADFGDGYSQEAGDGINTLTDSWSISVRGRLSGVVGDVKSFIDRHGGYMAFEWDAPAGGRKLFKCREGYSLAHESLDIYTLSATFEEVHQP